MITKIRSLLLSISILMTFNIASFGQSSHFSLGGAHNISIAGTGSTFEGISAIYTNPAGLTSLERFSVDISYDRRFNLAELSTTSIAAAKKIGKSAIGVSVARYGYSTYSESKVGLTYARKLFSNISIGGTFDMLRYNINQYGNATKFTFEIGVLSSINKRLSLGAYFFNPGNLSLTENQDIPSRGTIGIRYKASQKAHLYVDISKTINRNPDFKFSVEYQMVKNLSIRGGANITQSSLHFGPAYSFSNGLRITGGYSYNNDLGHTTALSLSFVPSLKETE